MSEKKCKLSNDNLEDVSGGSIRTNLDSRGYAESFTVVNDITKKDIITFTAADYKGSKQNTINKAKQQAEQLDNNINISSVVPHNNTVIVNNNQRR